MGEHIFTDSVALELLVKGGVIEDGWQSKFDPRNLKAIQDRAAKYADVGMDFGSAFSKACEDYVKAILKMREHGEESGMM